jgi:hypothetical protein
MRNPLKLNLPDEMTVAMVVYNEFYHEVKNSRTLNWSMTQGSMVITSQFGGVFYDIQVFYLNILNIGCNLCFINR